MKVNSNTVVIKESKNVVTKEQEEKTVVERKPFFNGIAKVLSIFEQKDFTCKEDIKTENWDDDDDFCNDCGSKSERTYSIYLENKQLVSHTMTSAYLTGTNDYTDTRKCNNDIFVKLPELKKTMLPLIIQYPYLNYFMDQIKPICFNNQGKISETKILEIAKDYANNNFKPEQRCHALNKIITYTL